ncbi:hypothetical protein OG453_44560 [Streptomyces sp. NBC_01381]|uniref:hypothetical protein n=1 Tax=Streptomyces sp. NBC_01381 TaxID=2903845 RepID=UPI00225B5CA4|nr:hypothetical protein [Streptomyces sp. NBC_01381]MCX4673632.1 hypothetical protein [Streptomyces sp. NBC_01381]
MSDLTYKALVAQVNAYEKNLAKSAEQIRTQAKIIDDDAQDTGRVADQIAGKSVDPETVGETRDLMKITAGVSEGAIEFAAAADDTSKQAKASAEQAKTTYGGLQEAMDRSTLIGKYDISADWLQQE